MDGHESFEETKRRWMTTCSICGESCAGPDVKELALGHVMHLACYDRWLESQDDGAQHEAKLRNLAAADALRRRMDEWVATANWIRRER